MRRLWLCGAIVISGSAALAACEPYGYNGYNRYYGYGAYGAGPYGYGPYGGYAAPPMASIAEQSQTLIQLRKQQHAIVAFDE